MPPIGSLSITPEKAAKRNVKLSVKAHLHPQVNTKVFPNVCLSGRAHTVRKCKPFAGIRLLFADTNASQMSMGVGEANSVLLVAK
jgi:hypothetical protein